MGKYTGDLPPDFFKSLELYERITAPLKGIQKQIDVLNGIHVNPILKQLEMLDKIFPPGLRATLEALDQLSEKQQKIMVELASRGWFVGLSLPIGLQRKVSELLESELDLNTLDQTLVTYYEKKFKEIELVLIAKHESRKEIIQQLFNAHHQGLYCLTTPTAFAQVDGICSESCFGGYFFMRTRGRKLPQVSKAVEDAGLNSSQLLILSPFLTLLPITHNVKEREEHKTEDQLNRHTIVHGESTEYGNRVNSAKSLVLLQYVSSALIG